MNFFIEQAVRADEHIQISGHGLGQDFLLFLGWPEAVQHITGNAEIAEPFRKGLKMLLRQNRRRHEDRHLLAAHGGLENSPQGYLGLTEAHIATDEAVHGKRLFHAALYIADGLELVLCFFIFLCTE